MRNKSNSYQPFISITEDLKDASTIPSPVQVVRLNNGKLGVYVREDGSFRPFMYRGIETGFYDLRANTQTMDEWDDAFRHIRMANANTVEFMIQFLDIEPEEGRFDWKVPDKAVELAANNGLKIRFVYFTSLMTGMHFRYNLMRWDGQRFHESDRQGRNTLVDLPDARKPWLYSDPANIQWSFDRYTGRIMCSSYEEYFEQRLPVFLCYANPRVHGAVQQNLRALVGRYRESSTVVGYQVTNEEGGLQFFWSSGDANPLTAGGLREFLAARYTVIDTLNDHWGTAYSSFDEIMPASAPFERWGEYRRELVTTFLRGLMRAAHQVDPYRPLFLNVADGDECHRDGGLYNSTGTDASTYRTSCADGVAAMLYQPANRDKTVLNRICDELNINAPADVLLATTEIGIGTRFLDLESQFPFGVYQYLQRGGQGYAAYDWGEMVTPHDEVTGEPNKVMDLYRSIADMVEQNEDVLFAAIPVDTVLPERSRYRIEAVRGSFFEVTTLKVHYDASNMIGLAYNHAAQAKQLIVTVIPAVAGSYTVTLFRPGKQKSRLDIDLRQEQTRLELDEVGGRTFAIIRIERNDE